ncbi:hypothetical protein [Cellulomonas hominis]
MGATALLAPALVLAGAGPAAAAAAMVTDCDFWTQETFYRNQPVCVTGDLDYVPPGYIIPTADIYVSANTTWNAGDRAVDVTGSINRFQSFGTFYDEYAWLPTLEAGRYDILIDNDLNGTWDPAHDILLGAGPDAAFEVVGTDLAGYSFDSASVKGEAQAQVGGWSQLSNFSKYVAGVQAGGAAADAGQFAASAGWNVKLASVAGGGGSLALDFLGLSVPTSYNDGVLAIGGQMIRSLAGTQATHYQNLADDPADPAYGRAVGLDMDAVQADLAGQLADLGLSATYPFTPASDDPAHLRQVHIATLQAEQAATVQAVIDAHERLLGARDADDVRWTVSHAASLEQYTSELVSDQQELVTLLQAERDDLATQPGADDPIDVAALTDLQDRLATTGLTAQEIADYEAIGFTAADAQVVVDRVLAFDLPATDLSALDAYDAVLDASTNLLTTFQAAADEAATLSADLIAQVQTVALPALTLTGPGTTVVAGASTTLTATATGGTGALSVRWDLDVDGDFDDATGTSAALIPTHASDQLVGARVTDSRGLSTTTYLRVVSEQASAPAQITSTSPATGRTTLTGGSAQTFTVAAIDPEAAPVTYQWYVDDTPVAAGPSYTHATTAGERSIHAIRVVVSDGDNTHTHPSATWALSTLP